MDGTQILEIELQMNSYFTWNTDNEYDDIE